MLWIPGPTEVRPAVFAELQKPMIGHRSQAMIELIERIDPPLRLAFGLAADSPSLTAVGTHSATAMMEGSLLGVGPRVLAVVNGAFSKRWGEIARTLGKDVTTLEVDWGAAVTGEALAQALAGAKPFDAVTLVGNETSTGVRTPLGPLASVLEQHPGTMLLVDVVSAIAGYALDFDVNRLDFALAGVNKALALPPGITVMCASERYLAGARARERRAWYLDPVRTIEGHVARKTPTTPSIPLYRALARQLEDITAGVTLPESERGKSGAAAWDARYAKHERMRTRTLEWAAGHGLEPFPAADLSSPTVSCLRAGELDVAALIAGLKQRGHEIGNGYGKLKGETFRIGHMGDHTEEGLAQLLAAADQVLA
jgi:aspartate aminotransferase-like enzyme